MFFLLIRNIKKSNLYLKKKVNILFCYIKNIKIFITLIGHGFKHELF